MYSITIYMSRYMYIINVHTLKFYVASKHVEEIHNNAEYTDIYHREKQPIYPRRYM